jgi:hypothetical protein
VRADWASGRGTGRDAGRGAQVAGRRALVAGHWSCVYLCLRHATECLKVGNLS